MFFLLVVFLVATDYQFIKIVFTQRDYVEACDEEGFICWSCKPIRLCSLNRFLKCQNGLNSFITRVRKLQFLSLVDHLLAIRKVSSTNTDRLQSSQKTRVFIILLSKTKHCVSHCQKMQDFSVLWKKTHFMWRYIRT